MEIRQGAQINKIRAEVHGEEDEVQVAAKVVSMVDLEEEDQVVERQWVDVVEEEEDLILWRDTSVGCVAIWPVTIPTLVHIYRRCVVAVLALPKQVRLNLGKQAQDKGETMDSRFGSGD